MEFVGVPDMMEHTKCVFDIPLLCKSKMAATIYTKFLKMTLKENLREQADLYGIG